MNDLIARKAIRPEKLSEEIRDRIDRVRAEYEAGEIDGIVILTVRKAGDSYEIKGQTVIDEAMTPTIVDYLDDLIENIRSFFGSMQSVKSMAKRRD